MSLELIPNAIGQPDMKYEAYEDNAAAFNELLKQIEEASATSASQRDKGTRFETLTRVFFENARGEFSGRYSKIETFKEWVRS